MNRVYLILIVLFLAGCAKNVDSERVYVDIEEKRNEFEELFDKNLVDNLLIDDKKYSYKTSSFSMGKNYFLVFQPEDKFIVDISYGKKICYCTVPGCSHDINKDKECLIYKNYISPCISSDFLYYTDYNRPGVLFADAGDGAKEVYKNENYTELDEKYKPGRANAFSYFYRGNYIYIIGVNSFYIIDADTKEKLSEPVIISDSQIMTFDVCGDTVYIVNESYELISYNITSEKITKISDKVFDVQCSDEFLVYIKKDGLGMTLQMINRDDYNLVTAISNVDSFSGLFLSGNNLFYVSNEDHNIYCYNSQTNNTKIIYDSYIYSNGVAFDNWEYSYIVSAPSSKYVYCIKYGKITGILNRNMLMVIDKETLECTMISLGLFDGNISNAYGGEIIAE